MIGAASVYDAVTWMNHSTIKGKVIGLGSGGWALENQPLSLWLTVVVETLPSELQQDGITIKCNVINLTENDPRGVDAYAVVDNCRKQVF